MLGTKKLMGLKKRACRHETIETIAGIPVEKSDGMPDLSVHHYKAGSRYV